jgi:hypothetical protein
MTRTTVGVTGGVDTHGQSHHAAVIDHLGRQLGDREFPALPAGYDALVEWLQGHGELDRVGVGGTGTYGAGSGYPRGTPDGQPGDSGRAAALGDLLSVPTLLGLPAAAAVYARSFARKGRPGWRCTPAAPPQ